MAILKRHLSFYQEIFKLPNIISEPFLMIGYQDILGEKLPKDFDYKDFKELLISKGIKNITIIDLFDDRADLKYDLNLPVPDNKHEKYNVVFDIGSLEHIFDTKQCLENCMRMVKPGGVYFLHTPVKGYFSHGLHTFSPELIKEAFRLNKFEIKYLKYSSRSGFPVKDPLQAVNSIIWIVGKKKNSLKVFQIPQQKRCYYIYQPKGLLKKVDKNMEYWFRQICPPILISILRKIL